MRAASRCVALLAPLLLALSLAGAASADVRSLTIDRGVVQTVSTTQIVLRELDGSSVALSVDSSTRVSLNGSPAQITDIRPGFVAAVAHDGALAARFVRAFGRDTVNVERGVVVSASARQFTIRRSGGSLLTLRITPSTHVRLNGFPTTQAAIRPGRFVRVRYAADGTAKLVQLFGRRGP
jgi:hypothetical protein